MPGAVGGPPRYLNNEEEEELVRWLKGCAEVGCAKSIGEVRAVVGAMVAKKHNLDHVTVSHGRWDRFRARHSHLRLRAGECLAYVRAVCTNHQILDKYFDLWERVVLKNDLNDKPNRIFNLDESGIPLQHQPGKRMVVLAEKQGINFMPFYSPTCRKAEFSCEEKELFQHCFEEGYDLTHDCRGAGDQGGKPGKSDNSCDIKINVCRLTWQTTAVNSLISVVDRLQGRPVSAQDYINMGLLQ